VLVEHGDKEMTDEQSVAEYIIFELVDIEFKNEVFGKFIRMYMDAYQNDIPFENLRSISSIEDREVRECMIEMLSTPHEISKNWFDRHEIVIKDVSKTFKNDVVSVMRRFRYYKLMEVLKILDEKIKTAEQSGRFEEMIAAIMKKMELLDERKILAREIQTVKHPY